MKVDAETGDIVFGIHEGRAVAFTEDSAWVAVGGEELREIDPQTGQARAAVAVPGNYATAGAGSIWVPGETEAGPQIARIDLLTSEVVAVIPIDARSVEEVAVDDAGVWATSKRSGTVIRIDPATNEIETDIGAHGIVIDASGVWVTNYSANSVSRIDPATNQVEATIAGIGSGVGIAAGGGAIWVSTQDQGISRIDPATNEPELVVELPSGWHYGLAFGDDALWVSSVGYQFVYRIPVASLEALHVSPPARSR